MEAEQEPAFSESAVRQALGAAFHVAGIERRVQRDRRTRLPAGDVEQLGPLDALRRYFEAKAVPSDREQLLVRYASRLIQDEMEGSDG